jgi:hypothetical protein
LSHTIADGAELTASEKLSKKPIASNVLARIVESLLIVRGDAYEKASYYGKLPKMNGMQGAWQLKKSKAGPGHRTTPSMTFLTWPNICEGQFLLEGFVPYTKYKKRRCVAAGPSPGQTLQVQLGQI